MTTRPAPTPKPKPNPKPGGGALTQAEVAKHSSKSDCWVVINGNVYDATGFRHPGGQSKIKCGQDISGGFSGHHGGGGNVLGRVRKKGALSR
jgi:hypothetical protein